MRTALLLVVGVSMALVVAGCGDDSAVVPTTPPPSSGAVLPGGGLSVAEAISTDADPPLAVGGWVGSYGEGSGLDRTNCSLKRARSATLHRGD